MKIVTMMAIITGIVLFFAASSFTLTTDELLQLKKADIPEDIILYMIDAGYKDIDRVVKLKEGGFKNETILSIIKKDLKSGPSAPTPESLRFSGRPDEAAASVQSSESPTASRIKILWYAVFGAGPVLQSSQTIDHAMIYRMGTGKLRLEWADKGAFDIIFKKPFKSPFYWDINKNDTFGPGKDGYPYMLQSAVSHKGRPETDDTHYWVVCLDPNDRKIIEYIQGNLVRE